MTLDNLRRFAAFGSPTGEMAKALLACIDVAEKVIAYRRSNSGSPLAEDVRDALHDATCDLEHLLR